MLESPIKPHLIEPCSDWSKCWTGGKEVLKVSVDFIARGCFAISFLIIRPVSTECFRPVPPRDHSGQDCALGALERVAGRSCPDLMGLREGIELRLEVLERYQGLGLCSQDLLPVVNYL